MIIRKKYGWSGYADGLFWIVNPHDYSLIVSEWLKGTPFSEKDNYHLIALSGFGDMYLWGEETANSLLINSSLGHFYPANKSSLINSDGEMDKLANFFLQQSLKKD